MKKKYLLDGLGCASCASKMEDAICKLDGVESATVNFITTKLVIEGEEKKMQDIIERSKKIVKKIEPQVVMKKA